MTESLSTLVEPKWWGAHLRELWWQAELARLLADPVWRRVGLPRGAGAPVLLIAGFLAGDESLAVMGTWLRDVAVLVTREQRGLSHRLVVPVRHAPTWTLRTGKRTP